ncbi:MAG TPA: efflux RND transporter permease subunit [Bacteroidota bacterium]|nr:efflux RND transporter permease subunit [Bacteroidota bacterium]
MTITELSIKRPTLVVVVFSVLGVLGIFSYTQLKYELLPKITPPYVTITTIYPGASPAEVETSVTKVIEDAVSGIDKVANVYATSSEGVSLVSMEFTMSADVNISLQDAQRKVSEVSSKLPSGAKNPTFSKFALDELPVLRIGATGNIPSRRFFKMLDDLVRPRLAKLEGVGQITLVGGDEREIRVNIDAEKLRSCGLNLLQVDQMIRASNLDFPTGKVEQGSAQYIVRLAGKYRSMDELRRLVIGTTRQGGSIRVGDVAEVEDGRKDYTQLSRINGKSSVGIIVQKQGDANAVEVSKVVRAEMADLEKEYAGIGLAFEVAQDGSTFTVEAADAVKHDLVLAIIFVAVVMLAFLHSIRNSVIVMIAIPSSLVSTFIMILAFGFSLNLMTLLGLSLVIGILVDDSIVVLENIHRHLEKGDEMRVAALKGRNEIGFAALSITMVDVVVFVPLALVSGLIGNIMREFALVVVSSTLMSLFVSFTITPLLASRFSKIEQMTAGSFLGRFALWFERRFHTLTAEYLKTLEWSLAHRGRTFLLALGLFVGSMLLPVLGFIGSEFMPQSDRGEFTVTMELPSGSSLANTNYVTLDAERIVFANPEVERVFTNVGVSTEGFVGQSSNYLTELNVTLVPREKRKRSTDEVSDAIKKKIQQIPGVQVRTSPIGIFGTANQSPIALLVSAPEYTQALRAAEGIAGIVRTVPGTADVRLSSEMGKPEMQVEIDREKMASFGLSMNEVGEALRIAFNGDDESKFREGTDQYPIRVVLDRFDRSRTEDIGSLTFGTRSGRLVQLKQFATVSLSTGPTKLQRQNRNYSVTVNSQAVARPAGSIVADIRSAVARNPLPPGVAIAYLGDEKNRSESFASLLLALAAAILFVYMIMVALYDSFVYPFVVLFSIPVAVIGAFLALALTMKALNIFTMLGIIMLVGLVGKNAILLVDRTNQMRKEKSLSVHDALVEAAQTRLRPILMTTASMVVGMSPIAFSLSSGSEFKSGLAWALIGGLLSSLLLTLVLVPVVYSKVDQWRVALTNLQFTFAARNSAKTTPGVPAGIRGGAGRAVAGHAVSGVSHGHV